MLFYSTTTLSSQELFRHVYSFTTENKKWDTTLVTCFSSFPRMYASKLPLSLEMMSLSNVPADLKPRKFTSLDLKSWRCPDLERLQQRGKQTVLQLHCNNNHLGASLRSYGRGGLLQMFGGNPSELGCLCHPVISKIKWERLLQCVHVCCCCDTSGFVLKPHSRCPTAPVPKWVKHQDTLSTWQRRALKLCRLYIWFGRVTVTIYQVPTCRQQSQLIYFCGWYCLFSLTHFRVAHILAWLSLTVFTIELGQEWWNDWNKPLWICLAADVWSQFYLPCQIKVNETWVKMMILLPFVTLSGALADPGNE